MSAIPTTFVDELDGGNDGTRLAPRAAVYFFVVAAAYACAAIPLLAHLKTTMDGWLTFGLLGASAAVAQLFVVRTPRNQSYHATIAFLIPAAILLPPELVPLVAVAQHIPEWLKNRTAWYIQTFNIFNWTLAMLAAWGSFHGIDGAAGLIPNGDVRFALGGFAASAALVSVNHVLIAPMLHLARGHSIRELGVFSFESLSTDVVLATLGVGIGAFWNSNPWLIPFSVTPLLLIHRSLSVPQLQEEARVDPKTGLFNARHFATMLTEELARAARFERPLSLIMADLDLLRDINNTYGHLAVYRAKLQGRNRVLDASSELLALPEKRSAPLVAVPEDGEHVVPLPPPMEVTPIRERRHPRPHAVHGPRFFSLSKRLAALVGLVAFVGAAAGIAGLVFGHSTDILGLVAIIALVGAGQALALQVDDGTISVSAVGALAGAAIFGPRAALALAVTTAALEWSARRAVFHQALFNVGALSLASLAAAGVFGGRDFFTGDLRTLATVAVGAAAGLAYFAVNTGLLSFALAVEGHERWWRAWHERFAWLTLHYLVYGFIGGVIAVGYGPLRLYALAVFAVPLLLMRKTQEAYLRHTQRSAQKLREAAETIQTQNISLEQANRLLKERSTAAMESLSATVDARDAYTAGHSRRVQQLALAIGRELGLSQAELDLLGHAALFHDIGKLAIPDSILLKPASLTDEEWSLMQRHADEGARIIDRLGFLNDAVPAIRHHHERYDGTGYPDRLKGEEIPLGARIIHVADALDSMLTTRIYRAARPAPEALDELRRAAGTQFCPRVVTALERILPVDGIGHELERPRALAAS